MQSGMREPIHQEHPKLHCSAALPQPKIIRISRLSTTTPHTPPLISSIGSILRRGTIIPLRLAGRQEPCRDQAAHKTFSMPRFSSCSTLLPTPLSATPLDTESIGVPEQSLESRATKTFSTISRPVNITSGFPLDPSLRSVRQGRYIPATKKGKSRYGSRSEASLDRVVFGWRSDKGERSVSVARILNGTESTSVDGADEPVLQRHGTNVTLHILVCHPKRFGNTANACLVTVFVVARSYALVRSCTHQDLERCLSSYFTCGACFPSRESAREVHSCMYRSMYGVVTSHAVSNLGSRMFHLIIPLRCPRRYQAQVILHWKTST